jgi:predicted nucleic acid-binding protein
MIVADSDVIIDALSGRDPERQFAAALRAGTLATTTISTFELESGARSDAAREAVRVLLDAVPALHFDQDAARQAADVRRALEQEGRTIGMADYLIAGICLARGARLLTRNRAHFERVPGLVLA